MRINETPRDGWQGIEKYIPVEKKAEYINSLMNVGFDIIELGSFVSPRSVPQLADTKDLIDKIKVSETGTRTMVLVASKKGGEAAVNYNQLDYVSYPYSISETFLKRNLNASKEKAEAVLNELNNVCLRAHKELVVYIAMGFGNPYGDHWSLDLLTETVDKLACNGIHKVLLTDIVGLAMPDTIKDVYKALTSGYSEIEFGLHLHTTKETFYEKVKAAFDNGCERFDTVLTGIGGCPFTGKELVGNLNTFDLIEFMKNEGIDHKLNLQKLKFSSEILFDILKGL